MFCIKCGAECEDYEEGGILRQRCPRCGHIHYQILIHALLFLL